MSNPTSTDTADSGPTASTGLPDLGSARLEQLGAAIRADPEQIGPYHVLGRLGEGGMGIVFKAEQREPVRRTVALKLIRAGLDSEQVLARFDSERQALAMMDHPHVARVLDAGTTEGGRPYFVMELVAGEPITAFCDRHRYTTPQRLALFIQACEATQHAHQKAIIHRDLKPSNILVTVVDDKPLVKVIDFGVAKALTEKLTDRTLYTSAEQLLGTPEYMSPEQAEGSLDLDTRTDVYALGVVLYELLCGALPFEPQALRGASFAEVQRIIRDVEPPRPSARLSSLGGERAAEVAGRRQTQLPQLTGQLRRELEWIPLKAMSKDRTRRYASADQLAEDVRNYLEQRPLLAGPETLAYRARKFVRRNKGAAVAVTAVVLALLIGGIVSSALAFRLKRSADAVRAEQRTTQAVLEFLTEDMLGAADPEKSRVAEMSVKQALDNAAAGVVAGKFADQPLVEAAVRHTVATTYCMLGRHGDAEPHARTALERRRRLLGDDDADTITSINLLGYSMHGQGKFVDAEPLYREAVDRGRRALGADDARTLKMMSNLAGLMLAQGKYAEAERLHRQALEGKRRTLGDEHEDTFTSMQSLAMPLYAQGKLTEAESQARAAVAGFRRVLGNDHPVVPASLRDLGTILEGQGKSDEAEALYRESIDAARRVVGDDHPDTVATLHNLATLLCRRQKYAEAEALYRDAIERIRRVRGEQHPDLMKAMSGLGIALLAQGRHVDAEALFRQALDAHRRIWGDDNADTLRAINNLAHALSRQDRRSEAEPLFAELYRRAPTVEMDPREAANLMSGWGVCLVKLGRLSEAEPALREAQRRLNEAGVNTLDSVRNALAEVERAATQPATTPVAPPPSSLPTT